LAKKLLNTRVEEEFEIGEIVRWRREYYRVESRERTSDDSMPTFVYDLTYLCHLNGVKAPGSLHRRRTWPDDLARPDCMMLIALELM
jgi:hypothetical protein